MAGDDDLLRLDEARLVREYIDNIQAYAAIEHVGAQNRLMTHRNRIVARLREGSETLMPLRALLDHEDAQVRYSTAFLFRGIDHAAFDRTMRALAARSDNIGWEAKNTLEWDARERARKEEQPQPASSFVPVPNAKLHWQCDHAPPPALTRAEIEQRLATGLPAQCVEPLLRLARPAIGLWPQRPPSDMPATASRLGGMPLAPPGWSWPTICGEPMFYLGHVNCAELRGLPGAERLPATGLLAFFGDHDAVMACDITACDIAVFHWADLEDLAPAAPPIEVQQVLPAAALAFRPLVDLPDPHSNVVQEVLGEDEELTERYDEAFRGIRTHGIPEDVAYRCSFGKLFGWPCLVQKDDLGETIDPDDADGFRLLLQLDDYSNGEDIVSWGPGGSLYFLIRDQDLDARRFDQCAFEIQFT